MTDDLTDAERYPWLNADSRQLLAWLHEHPSAPRFHHRAGDRLTAAGLARVQQFELELAATAPGWRPGQPPPWLAGFVVDCFRDVPFYRAYGAAPPRLPHTP